nr:2-acylglycerol O-acyltransferase 1-like [Onthophagus taurus]XP_022911992.1 2-acylglycerol O-acyltransferase 1-like [Onthophagus taurus]
MEIFGIEFAPLNIPLKRRLQTVAAASWFVIMIGGGLAGLLLSIYLIIFSSLRWLVILYLIWIWGPDSKISERGGRRSEWIRDWTWWKYLKHYFPLSLERVPWVSLDPHKNYLFCCFPHGMLSTGPFSAFGTKTGGFHDLFPYHTPYVMTLKQHYVMPFFRELALGLGGLDASKDSINYVLSKPEGGNVCALMVGGAAEAFNCRPGEYRLILKNRKGFVRLALKNGAPLVPVISFGETDLYNQVNNPEGSKIRNIQEALKKYIGWAPAIPIGRGFFQYNYGIIPKRKPVTTLVGRPIDVKKVEDPTREQIDDLHAVFIKELVTLFEQEKHRYIKNHENIHLEIE